MVSREMIAPTVEHSSHLSSHPLIPPSLNLLSSSHPPLSQSPLILSPPPLSISSPLLIPPSLNLLSSSHPSLSQSPLIPPSLSQSPLILSSLPLSISSHPLITITQSSLSPSLNLLTFARAVKRVNFVAPLSPKEIEGGREGGREIERE
jgi:hypothetical protein